MARPKKNDAPTKLTAVTPCVVCAKTTVAMVAFQCTDGSTAWYCSRCFNWEGG